MQIDINIDSSQIAFYLVRQYKKIQMWFIATKELSNTKDILINGKLFQEIGVVYLSEIKGWKHIKKVSHWTNAVLTDSKYPIAAKHFAFRFETTDLHHLSNFEYSLLDNKAKLIEFKSGEDKISALDFTIQIIT